MNPTVAILKTRASYRWESMNHVLASIERGWSGATAFGLEVFGVVISSERSLQAAAPRLKKARRIVIPSIDPVSIRCIRRLRTELGVRTPLVVHFLGEAATGALVLEPVLPLLTREDVFVVCSTAARDALRVCFPAASIQVVRYAIASATVVCPSQRRAHPAFLYLGRISQQKNLHGLLRALAELRKLAPRARWSLTLHGQEDRLGSPYFGVQSQEYARTLRKYVREWGLSGRVRFGGHLSQQQIRRKLASRRWIGVSASLHTDDELSVSSIQILSAGHRAVLSAWGGHRDLAASFRGRVQLVRVDEQSSGPNVDPRRFARALLRALRDPRPRRNGGAPSTWRMSEALAAIARRTPPRGVLQGSAWRSRLLEQRMREKWKGLRVYRDYADPLARPILRAYGMRRWI